MTPDQEKIAEAILKTLSESEYSYIQYPFNPPEDRTIIIQELIDRKLIARHPTEHKRYISTAGKFKSFKHEHEKEDRERLTKSREGWYKRNWVAVAIFGAALTAGVAILKDCNRKAKSQEATLSNKRPQVASDTLNHP